MGRPAAGVSPWRQLQPSRPEAGFAGREANQRAA